MSERMSSKCKFRAAYLFPVLMVLGLGACQEPTRPADYRDAFPLTVAKETVALSVRAPSGTLRLTGQEALDFKRFVRDYHNRGRQALTIRASAGRRGRDGAERLRGLLQDAGVPERDITLVGAGSGDIVTLSFNAFKVKVPECGDFTSKTTPNWSNRRHSNFGCAYRRNMGLMIEDPGDLKKAKTMSPGDGRRAAGIVSGYQGGAAATEETTTEEAQ
jgi:pilus biogenesis lipoprotein CpaD